MGNVNPVSERGQVGSSAGPSEKCRRCQRGNYLAAMVAIVTGLIGTSSATGCSGGTGGASGAGGAGAGGPRPTASRRAAVSTTKPRRVSVRPAVPVRAPARARAQPKIIGPKHPHSFRWASFDDDPRETTVQIRDLSGSERKALATLEGRYKNKRDIPLTESRVPPRFRAQRPWLVLTPRGTFKLPVKGYRLTEEGEGTKFYVVLAAPAGKTPSAGLIIASGRLKRGTKLRRARTKRLVGALRARLLRAIVKQAKKLARSIQRDGATLPALLRNLRRKLRGTTTTLRGRFPPPHKQLAVVTLSTARVLKADEEVLSALLALGAGGRITAAPQELSVTLDRYRPLYVVDADGDGFDDVVFEDRNYEGLLLKLLRWERGKPKVIAMSGDGG